MDVLFGGAIWAGEENSCMTLAFCYFWAGEIKLCSWLYMGSYISSIHFFSDPAVSNQSGFHGSCNKRLCSLFRLLKHKNSYKKFLYR